jgi:uridylate kinase
MALILNKYLICFNCHLLTISFDEVYKRGLKVMDLTATTMCKENNLPIVVFNMDIYGNLKRLMQGENIGTVVK